MRNEFCILKIRSSIRLKNISKTHCFLHVYRKKSQNTINYSGFYDYCLYYEDYVYFKPIKFIFLIKENKIFWIIIRQFCFFKDSNN